MQDQWDLIVVGAGPSGLNAAAAAAENGLEVLLVDEQDMPGGQIYRKLPAKHAERRFLSAEDRKNGLAVIQRFTRSGAAYQPNTTVWFAEPGRVLCSHNNQTKELKAHYLVVATGAMERPVPFTGWTLPGVMGAGASDILQKDAGVTPKGPVVIAGNGPLIPLVASHLVAQKVDIAAILDTRPLCNAVDAAPALPRALQDIPFLLKGAKMVARVKVSDTPM
ncbi:MAG: NAD(P)/FAD-dependent oxidoreductase, partial [Desulfobacterales bacterium]|nr:NAD(P)/FAD-dependent oxidoreductase [Desulfobacterales bacterium]